MLNVTVYGRMPRNITVIVKAIPRSPSCKTPYFVKSFISVTLKVLFGVSLLPMPLLWYRKQFLQFATWLVVVYADGILANFGAYYGYVLAMCCTLAV